MADQYHEILLKPGIQSGIFFQQRLQYLFPKRTIKISCLTDRAIKIYTDYIINGEVEFLQNVFRTNGCLEHFVNKKICNLVRKVSQSLDGIG